MKEKHELLGIRGYLSRSDGMVVVETGKDADTLKETLTGEGARLEASGFIEGVGFTGAADPIVIAETSYAKECAEWKKRAQAIGDRFLFASCESKNSVRVDAEGPYSDEIRFESRGTIYYTVK